MAGKNTIKKIIQWITSLLLILVVGLIGITLYSACYSFGTMIFGVHIESAIKDFWGSELLLGVGYTVVVLVIGIVTQITRLYKKKRK